MLDKNKFKQFFNLSSKWVVKQWRQFRTSTTFGPGTANENTVHCWLKKFCKVYERLEDEPWSMVAGHQKLTTTNWEPSLKLILLCLEKLLKNSKLTILWPFGIWSKLESWKTTISGYLMNWQKKKIITLKCHLLLLYATMNDFSIGLWCATESGFYTTTSDDQFSGWTEKKLQSSSQSQTCTTKDHGHCLVVCCPSDPLQLSEYQWNHYIWEVCSANQWDALKTAMPASGIGKQNRPNSPTWQSPTTW